MNCQSSACVGGNSPWPQKLWFQKSWVKTMLVIFFITQGVMHKEFVPEGQNLNFEFYREVMVWLLKRLWCVKLDKAQSGNWFLLHNNAPSHNATFVKQFLTKKSITVLYHPLYFPDLPPADYYLVIKLNQTVRGAILTPFQTSRTMWWVN
jgi:hypothetical protein